MDWIILGPWLGHFVGMEYQNTDVHGENAFTSMRIINKIS